MNFSFPLVVALCVLNGVAAQASPIVVSGWLTNVNSDDSPYEYAQFVATEDIDFAVRPFTILWNDVGLAGSTGTASFSDGWAGGSLLSYAFQLDAGTVTRGEVFYVGGSAQRLAGPGSASFADQRWLRTINTTLVGGDGLGTADATGVLGNGGPNADGIAVFAGPASAITSTSVPLDTVFFGNSVGTARPAAGGFKAAGNDRYTSEGVFGDAGNSFLFSDLAQNEFQRLSGTYDWAAEQWVGPRTGSVVPLNSGSQVSAIASGIALIPEPSVSLLMIGAAMTLSSRRHRKPR
ncbi:MAG: PEP-CTERM sorting domain-containing protein [Verrucomicrobiota bacterium]